MAARTKSSNEPDVRIEREEVEDDEDDERDEDQLDAGYDS